MIHWAILTGEYPPQPGGVSDYAWLVAQQLGAAGDEVIVYAPPQALGPEVPTPGVSVRRLPDRFGLRGLGCLDRELVRERPDRILLQYAPHAFGLKAMNLPFTTWVATRGARVAPLWVMFHEVAFPFVRRPLRHNVLALVNRAMARSLASRSDRLLVSIPSWVPLLINICRTARRAEWLPIPCSVATAADPDRVIAVRSQYFASPSEPLVGHFGTFGRLITNLLDPSVARLLATNQQARLLLIGRGSKRYCAQLIASHPGLADRLAATGELSPGELAAHLRACDLLLQPYPDGVSSRPSSAMARPCQPSAGRHQSWRRNPALTQRPHGRNRARHANPGSVGCG